MCPMLTWSSRSETSLSYMDRLKQRCSNFGALSLAALKRRLNARATATTAKASSSSMSTSPGCWQVCACAASPCVMPFTEAGVWWWPGGSGVGARRGLGTGGQPIWLVRIGLRVHGWPPVGGLRRRVVNRSLQGGSAAPSPARVRSLAPAPVAAPVASLDHQCPTHPHA
jgi:hypothetical protein